MATYPIGKISLNLCGAYSETATYQQLDVVLYKGSSYVCIYDLEDGITNVLPTDTTKWVLLAGGLDLSDKQSFREDLGIYTGTTAPTAGDYDEGDIYILYE